MLPRPTEPPAQNCSLGEPQEGAQAQSTSKCGTTRKNHLRGGGPGIGPPKGKYGLEFWGPNLCPTKLQDRTVAPVGLESGNPYPVGLESRLMNQRFGSNLRF